MRSSSSRSSHASSTLDLVVTMSCGLTLQICLIIALSFCCRHWRFGIVNVSLAWSIAICTQELYTWPRVIIYGKYVYFNQARKVTSWFGFIRYLEGNIRYLYFIHTHIVGNCTHNSCLLRLHRGASIEYPQHFLWRN